MLVMMINVENCKGVILVFRNTMGSYVRLVDFIHISELISKGPRFRLTDGWQRLDRTAKTEPQLRPTLPQRPYFHR
jgi:hypothetical protein